MLKKLDSLSCYVSDTKKTAAFYQQLGFELEKEELGYCQVKIGDFELHFGGSSEADEPTFPEEAKAGPKGLGLYICIEVVDIDDYYQGLLAKDIKPSSEPKDWPWGNREFALRDPDGYKLVFYQPKG